MKTRGRGTGSIYKMTGSRYWWISYVSGGKRYAESTRSEIKKVAQDLLTSRLGDTQRGIVVTPKLGRRTLGEGLKAVIADQKAHRRRAIADIERQIRKHILKHEATDDQAAGGYFHPNQLMSTLTTADFRDYVAHRQAQGASQGTCNLELATIRRAYVLAVHDGVLVSKPHFPIVNVNNARQGFFERPQFDAILEHLPEHLQAPLQFAYITGWRLKSEVLPLTVSQVDLVAGVVRLEPGTTKNDEGREFYLTDDLRAVLETRLTSIEALKRQGVICPFLFHRPGGKAIKDFRTLWEQACRRAGYPGKLFHDFRRTAVRNLERAGVPRSAAMKMVGHKTESIYRRYAIVDAAVLREASAKLHTYTTEQQARAAEEQRGQVQRFSSKR